MKHNRTKRAARAAAWALCLLMLTALFTPAAVAADTNIIGVRLDGREVLSGRCLLYDSLTYVPLREMATLLGADEISWDARTRTAHVEGGGVSLSVKEGESYLLANGRALPTLGRVRNIDGRLYLPIRPLAKAYGVEVAWDGATRSVTLSRTGRPLLSGEAYYDKEDLYWLSRIISAEAGGESLTGQIAVGNVVLNRVASRQYPDSIYGVIFDFRYGTQFTPAATGTVHRTPTDSAVIAAKLCLEGYRLTEEALFFLNPRIAQSFWIVNNCRFVMRIGNHDFYA